MLVEETIALGADAVRLLRPRDSEALLEEDAFHDERLLPYWAELWPSGIALARAVAGRALRGRRVLDLGCGLGLSAVAAARAGGRVVASDWSTAALGFAAENAKRNGVTVETLACDWADPDPLVAAGPFGLVLAADVLYEQRQVGLLLDLLPRLGAEVLLADPGRAQLPRFLEGARPRWFVRTRRLPVGGVTVTLARLVRRP